MTDFTLVTGNEPSVDLLSKATGKTPSSSSPPANLSTDSVELPISAAITMASPVIGNFTDSTPGAIDGLAESIKAPHFSLPPLQGAWKVPLKLPLTTSHDSNSDIHGELTPSQRSTDETNKRFPWAAKMDPSSRNLYRATSPTYMDDGTPKVQIPSHVLLQGLQNQKEFVIGQFYRCSTPSPGLIHAIVNRIWGKKCKIFIRKLSDSSYLFHIPDKSTRSWVLQRGLWHIDHCLMFVAPWSPAATLALPEISTMPVWLTLKNIPSQLYSMQGISWIASGLGAPMATNKPRLDPTLMGEAKILVEIELNKPFPQKVIAEDKNGTLSMIDVEYSWLPSKCGRCDQLGHKESRCLEKTPITVSNKAKVSPLHEPHVNTEVVPPTTSHVTEVAPDDILLANTTTHEVVSLPTKEATSAIKDVPDYITSIEVHETTITVAEASHVTETIISTGISFDTHTTEIPTITTHSPSQLLLTPVVEFTDCGAILSEDETNVVYNDNSERVSLESFDNDISLMTPSTQRILRERPLKPNVKFQEGEWISAQTFRGKRSRGRRGRKFD